MVPAYWDGAGILGHVHTDVFLLCLYELNQYAAQHTTFEITVNFGSRVGARVLPWSGE